MNKGKRDDLFLSEFKMYLSEVLGIIAVLRLAIDPFPIMLKDEDIYYRMFETLTKAYSDEFVEAYIGYDMVDMYKKTQLYKDSHSCFMEKERQCPAISKIIQSQIIDTAAMGEIKKQLHLLCPKDVFIVNLFDANQKIKLCYSMGGLIKYSSDRWKWEPRSLCSEDFKRFSGSEDRYNIPYNNSYVSVFKLDGEDIYAEHDEKLSEYEYKELIKRSVL